SAAAENEPRAATSDSTLRRRTSIISATYRTSRIAIATDGMAWHRDSMFLPSSPVHVVDEWIPALDGVEAKLHAGARVADVGGGLPLSHGFPNSRVDNFDRDEVGTFPGAYYDLVASFDCLREEEDPVAVARHVRSS